MDEPFTVYIMWAIQLHNKTIVPWSIINVNSDMTILKLKIATLKSETYRHIKDIKDIVLIGNDTVLDDNKLIGDYSFIKDRSDIYLFNINEFGSGWENINDINDINIIKHLTENKECIKVTMHNKWGILHGIFNCFIF